MPKYLRQVGSGHIYSWTPALAKRSDMVVYDEDTATIRIEQLKRRIAEMGERKKNRGTSGVNTNKAMIDQAIELSRLESQVEQLEDEERVTDEADALAEAKGEIKTEGKTLTAEDIAEEERQKKIDSDVQVRKIRAMTDKDDIEAYMLEAFGENIDRRRSTESLKEYAEDKRIDLMFEAIK